MVQFFIDKKNKVPLYLQLKDQIQYFISTGSLTAREQLPPVKVLARTLGINFQTVRKAYKELKESGLIQIKHGEGTFISLSRSFSKVGAGTMRKQKSGDLPLDLQTQFSGAATDLIDRYNRTGLKLDEMRNLFTGCLQDAERSLIAPIIVFTECNQFQIKQISGILERELKLAVRPLLVTSLSQEIPRFMDEGREIKIVTTGFHVTEVRDAVGDLQEVQIEVLITNLNPETRRRLDAVGEAGKYSFICRDKESAVLYKDLLKAELGFEQIRLTTCTLSETAKVQEVLDSSDVILVSPPVYEEVRKRAAPGRSVYNLFERVDPMSLKVLKDKILGAP